MTGLPAFDEAEQRLRSFLERLGQAGTLTWAFREDVCRVPLQVAVRLPLPASNRACAQREYERGVQQGLGVSLQVFGQLGDQRLCYVSVPQDARDAEYRQFSPTDLKLSVQTPLPPARGITNCLGWVLYRAMAHWKWPWITEDDLPRRGDPSSSR